MEIGAEPPHINVVDYPPPPPPLRRLAVFVFLLIRRVFSKAIRSKGKGRKDFHSLSAMLKNVLNISNRFGRSAKKVKWD